MKTLIAISCQVWTPILDQVSAQLQYQVQSKVRDQVDVQIYSQIDSKVRDKIIQSVKLHNENNL